MPFKHKLSVRLAISRLFLHTAVFSMISCGDNAVAGPEVAGSIEEFEVELAPTIVDLIISPSSATIEVNDSLDFLAYGITNEGDSVEVAVTWTSSVENPVQKKGKGQGRLKAKKPGEIELSAQADSVSLADTVEVTIVETSVVDSTPVDSTVARIVLSPEQIVLNVGRSTTIMATLEDSSGGEVTDREPVWRSADESIVEVSGDGVITAMAPGSAVVSATDTIDNVSATSEVEVVVDVDTETPSVPSSVAAGAASPSQVDLTWAASTDNVGVVGYEISRNGSVVDSAVTTSYSDANLTPATLFVYTVSSFDAAGNESASSASASATTPGLPDTEAPTVPTNLTAVAVSSSRINLSWTASTDNVGVEGYEVSRDGVAIDSTSSTSYVDVGLSPSTEYTYRVSAYDLAGHGSGPSASASATTNAVVSGSPLLETTFDCGVQTQYNAPGGTDFDCDGLRRHTASTATDASGSHYDSITTAANYSGGLGGGGFRHKVGDGSNNQGGGVAVFFDTPQTELWIRAYFRYEAGFQWGGKHGPQPGYDKWYYIRNEGGVAAVAGFQSGVRGRLGIYRQSGLDRYPYVASEGWSEMYPGNVSDGSWYCVEYHIKMDTYTNGVSNGDGMTRIWLDGELVGGNDAYKWSDDVAAAAAGWTWFGIFTNQSQPQNGRVMYVDFDDLVIYNTTPPNVDAYGNPMIGPVASR